MNSKDYLMNLKTEIADINLKLNNLKRFKRRLDFKRRILKLLLILKLIYPAFISSTLIGGIFATIGITPFFIDKKKQALNTKKEIDSFNNISYESQYKKYDKAVNTISLVGTWKELDNGLYEREIQIYNVKSLDEDKMLEILNSNENILSFEELFDEKPICKKEGKNKLLESDMYKSPYLQAIIYSEDKKDIEVVKESISDNLGSTLAWFLISIWPALGSVLLIKKITKFDYSKEKENINDKYSFDEKPEELKRKLLLKQDNYNRLTRN